MRNTLPDCVSLGIFKTTSPSSVGTSTAPPKAAVKYTGLATPESVLYDAENDRYLVSNINGKPTEKDNNGFISVLSPDGEITTLKWIEGGKNKVKLDAPKGLALAKGVLYAADITVVRMFDAKTGAPKGDIPVPGSTFLNDLSSGPDGKIYVSDSGLKMGASGYRVLYTPHAVLYHHESLSKTSKDLIPHPEEVAAMKFKWDKVIAHDPYYSPNLTRVDEDFSLRTRV